MNQKPIRLLAVSAVVIALLGVVVALFVARPSPPPEYVESLPTPAGGLTKLALSPAGRHVAAGSAEGPVVLLNLISRRTEVLEAEGQSPLTMLTFSDDGLLLSGDQTGQLRAWQPPDFSDVELDEALKTSVPITCAAFRREGGSLEMILGLADGRLVSLGQADSGIHESGHQGLRAMTLTDDGATLITAGLNGVVRWHQLENHVALKATAEHETAVTALVWSPDGTRFASADWNGRICVWDAESRVVVARLSQPDAVSALVWTGSRVVTGSWDGHVRVWELTAAERTPVVDFGTGRPIHALVVEPSGDRILTVSNGDSIDVWRLDTAAASPDP